MLLATKWAGDKDRTEWKLLHSCGNIQPTALAFDNELVSIFHPNPRAAATICECVPEADKRDSEVLTRTPPAVASLRSAPHCIAPFSATKSPALFWLDSCRSLTLHMNRKYWTLRDALHSLLSVTNIGQATDAQLR
jgi:hypothetical protein